MIAWTSRSTRCSPSRVRAATALHDFAARDWRHALAVSRPTPCAAGRLHRRSAVLEQRNTASSTVVDHGAALADRVRDRRSSHRAQRPGACTIRLEHRWRDCLRGIAQRLRRIRMTLDEQRVRAGGQRGDRQRRHPRSRCRGVARIDRDREIGHVAKHRDRAHVEGVPGRSLERADTALAENDLATCPRR